MYVTLDVHVFLFVMRSGSIGTVTIYFQCSYIQFQRNKTENYEIIVAVDESGNANKFILPLLLSTQPVTVWSGHALPNLSIKSQVMFYFVIDKTYVFDLNPGKF